MKKIILLILSLLIFTGCYDYKELNDIAIVSGMAISYKNNRYEITLEIINTKKSDKENNKTDTLNITSTGNTPSAAINNTTAKVNKKVLFSHLQVVLLDESIAKKGITEISNYLIREIHISNNFYYILAKDCNAKDLLNVNVKNEPITSTAILSLFNNSNDIELLDLNNEFDILYGQLKEARSDIAIPSIILDKNSISLGTLGIFKEDKLIDYLSKEESQIYYLLKGKVQNSLFYNENTAVSIYQNDSKFKIKDSTVTLYLKANALITCLNDDSNLREGFKNKELSNYYSRIIKKKVKKLIEKSIETNSDFLGVNTIYYRYNPKNYQKNIYKTLKYKINIDLEVNRNGQTYEVID